jgi:hypothetical protein
LLRKLYVGLIALLALAGTGGAAYATYRANLEPVPTYDELSDELVINNTRDLEESKAFLAKYPDADVFADRSVKLQVFYQKLTGPLGDETPHPYVSLVIRMDGNGQPMSMELRCVTFDIPGYKVTSNIVRYLQEHDCFTTRPAPEPYAEPIR